LGKTAPGKYRSDDAREYTHFPAEGKERGGISTEEKGSCVFCYGCPPKEGHWVRWRIQFGPSKIGQKKGENTRKKKKRNINN